MREITLDAVRAIIAAVPATLRSELGLTPAQSARLTARIMREAEQRFVVNVSATIITLE
jgi:TctA family transporter